MIAPREVRRFIAENPALVGPHVDRIWLIDLLTTRDLQDTPKTERAAHKGARQDEGLSTPCLSDQIARKAA